MFNWQMMYASIMYMYLRVCCWCRGTWQGASREF
ncbi:hypothetical protein CIPAW_15G137200 [Carya illinoinensis]|uniref:Uncharacterized protein n=1 Tax=Carya illinoinensis TaxID=32201 RepID=A0A8T1NB45_CARIL|nr:hypothetical protein CIPAW_15G137200 [Carya illinoinensis]